MKVFFFINSIPPDYGGGYLRVFKTAARFKEYGELYRIGTFTCSKRFGEERNGVKNKDVLFLRNVFLASLFYLPFFIYRQRKSFNVFYVASTHWYTVIPSFVAKFFGKKVILGVTLSLVDSPAIRTNSFLKKPYYSFKNSQFKFADYIFVNSPLLKEECMLSGYGNNVVKLINNPVDTSIFYPVGADDKNSIKQSVGIVNDYPVILFVGSINKRKGCDLLPDIFERFFQNNSVRINFVMCGQIGYPETEQIIRELNEVFKRSGNTLIVQEEVSNTAPYYQMSDVFLFPTTNEGMPNVILEAMASGCMIICNHLEGITDYTLSEEFLVEENSVEGYVQKLLDYINNSDKYNDLIERNRKIIESRFSISAVDCYIRELLLS